VSAVRFCDASVTSAVAPPPAGRHRKTVSGLLFLSIEVGTRAGGYGPISGASDHA